MVRWHSKDEVERKDTTSCLPSCDSQNNDYLISSTSYPQKNMFFPQHNFCRVASHILQITCKYKARRYFLELEYPSLCQTLRHFDEFFGENSSCHDWPQNYFEKNSKINETLKNEMFKYGEENLALMYIYFQSPHLTKIMRNIDVTFVNYIANTGGLLGLFLGFSVISLFELLYWLYMCLRSVTKHIA